jgi:hypothetical protein
MTKNQDDCKMLGTFYYYDWLKGGKSVWQTTVMRKEEGIKNWVKVYIFRDLIVTSAKTKVDDGRYSKNRRGDGPSFRLHITLLLDDVSGFGVDAVP